MLFTPLGVNVVVGCEPQRGSTSQPRVAQRTLGHWNRLTDLYALLIRRWLHRYDAISGAFDPGRGCASPSGFKPYAPGAFRFKAIYIK